MIKLDALTVYDACAFLEFAAKPSSPKNIESLRQIISDWGLSLDTNHAIQRVIQALPKAVTIRCLVQAALGPFRKTYAFKIAGQ